MDRTLPPACTQPGISLKLQQLSKVDDWLSTLNNPFPTAAAYGFIQ